MHGKTLLTLAFLCVLQWASGQTGNNVLTAWTGTVNQTTLTISNLPANGRVIQLSSSITVSDSASFVVVDSSGQVVAGATVLSDAFSVVVTAGNGNQKTYTIQPGSTSLPVESVSGTTSTVAGINNKILQIGGTTTYHITNASNPLQGSFLQLVSDNVWLYFDNIKPSAFNNNYLAHIEINGQTPVIDSNIRLVQYLQGCVVISQSAAYQPLKVYTAANLGGSSSNVSLYTYYKSAQLGAMDNSIASFTLKKGYMATFAENENGTGASKVYIAADQDMQVTQLPQELKNKISLVRVFPWRWVAKKGWTNTVQMADTLGAKWTYNWNNERNSTLDAEYVPIRQTQWWPGFGVTNAKTNVTHLLGFNEPNSADQANLTPDQAIGAWPGLMESGLRLGSPAITDGGSSWLYSFMDKADSAGFRVDFVAVHFYRGCQTATQFYSFLKAIHDRTGRPIWITEFNNGANWTNTTGCPQPTYAQEATAIQSFLNMLDTTSFVERYALYEWVQDTRQMFYSTSPVVLNPAGVIYKDKVSPMAYNPGQAYDPYPPVTQSPFTSGNLAIVRFGNPSVAQSGANRIFIDEYAVNGTQVQSIALPVVKHGKNFPIVSSATPTTNSDGALALSADGNFISVLGYNTTVGSGSTNGVAATTTPRSVAVLDTNGLINTASSYNDVVSGHVTRGVIRNNQGLYMAGGSANGIRYAPLGSGITTTSTSILTTPGGTRKVGIYGGDIYFTQYTAGLSKLYKIAGTPTAAATPAALPGIPAASATTVASGFILFDVNDSIAGYDLLYYADETPTPSIQKYVFDGTTWVSKGSYTITGLNDNLVRDLTGTLVAGIPTLYGVSFTSVAKFTDNAASYTDNISITRTNIINNTASTNAAFRGISFVPGTPVITALDFNSALLANTSAKTVNSEILVYPNPTFNQLTIKVSQLKAGAVLRLYDARGALIQSQPLVNTIQTLPVKGLAPGIYFLQIRNGNKRMTEKIIKQ
jgi:hypothetical protein